MPGDGSAVNRSRARNRRVKKEWAEKPGRPLEQQLNDIVARLIAAAAVPREHRIAQEEDARRRHQEAVERWKREETEEAEARRFEELIRQVKRWRQANIRAYVKAVTGQATASHHRVPGAGVEEWATWALAHADRI